MRLTIIGTDHSIQHATGYEGSNLLSLADLEKMRAAFAQELVGVTEREGVTAIAEEANRSLTTRGSIWAAEKGIRWANIAPPYWYLGLAGIPSDADRYDGLSKEKYEEGFPEREAYMFREAQNFFEGSASALLIVGAIHLEPVAAMFRKIGCHPAVIDQRWHDWWRLP